MSKAGAINVYHCPDCDGYMAIEHVEEGVTPMFLACRVKGDLKDPANDCEGMMVSMMYPAKPWPIELEPGWEWFRPTGQAFEMLSPEMRDHIESGGLALRQKVAA